MTFTLGDHPPSPHKADSTPSGPVVVRAATRADVPSIVRLSDRFVAQDHLLPRAPAFFEDHIGELSVAELGTRLVGCVGVARLGPLAVIYNLCVSVTMQGLGVGRLLLAEAGRVGAEAGCASLLAASKHGGA